MVVYHSNTSIEKPKHVDITFIIITIIIIIISLWLTPLVAAVVVVKMAGTRGRSISLALLIVHLCGTEGKELLCFIYDQTMQFVDIVGITPSQVVPQGIESINGSNATMGCSVPLETINGVTTCGSPGNTGYSYLVDGCSPHVNTYHHDWASELVTVRMIESSKLLNYPHVLLTFGFDTPVSMTGMQIDMFNCPDWKIGFDYIIVYLNEEKNLTYSDGMMFVIPDYHHFQSSCNCLSTVTFFGGSFLVGYYHTVHILIDFSVYDDKFEWVVLGEVRFFDVTPQPILLSSVKTGMIFLYAQH